MPGLVQSGRLIGSAFLVAWNPSSPIVARRVSSVSFGRYCSSGGAISRNSRSNSRLQPWLGKGMLRPLFSTLKPPAFSFGSTTLHTFALIKTSGTLAQRTPSNCLRSSRSSG